MIYRHKIERRHGRHGVMMFPLGPGFMFGGLAAVVIAVTAWLTGEVGWGFAAVMALVFGSFVPLGWLLWDAEWRADRDLQAAYDRMMDARKQRGAV
jgi:hypothetical protein